MKTDILNILYVPEDNELNKLIDKLFTASVDTGNWDVIAQPNYNEFPQILFFDEMGNRIADAVCNPMSYGHAEGLIEVMGEPLCQVDDDDVEGYLTADDVFTRWMNYLREKV